MDSFYHIGAYASLIKMNRDPFIDLLFKVAQIRNELSQGLLCFWTTPFSI